MRVLAMRGAHVIGTARNMEKAKKASSRVVGRATPVVLELSDVHSAASCANVINAMDVSIDMLICNAGIMALPELNRTHPGQPTDDQSWPMDCMQRNCPAVWWTPT
ncbi:MAG: NADP-dependent 3-hydroxy acid dehydrogenase YdfG [Halieaceae bacterium]|jgi:NADP-dependent 3-hydroxy acid dehydrogenase YdfG